MSSVFAELEEPRPHRAPFFLPLAGPYSGVPYRDVDLGALHRNDLVTSPQAIAGAFSPEECDRTLGHAARATHRTGGMAPNVEGYRSVSSTWIMPEDTDAPWLYGRVAEVATAVRYWYGFEISGFFEPLLLVRYAEGDHFDWHLDCGAEGTCTRKLSLTIQLSNPEDYDGGDLEFFPQGPLPRSRRRGTVIAFPSFYTHRVQPVTRGVRSALVVWLHGPSYR